MGGDGWSWVEEGAQVSLIVNAEWTVINIRSAKHNGSNWP